MNFHFNLMLHYNNSTGSSISGGASFNLLRWQEVAYTHCVHPVAHICDTYSDPTVSSMTMTTPTLNVNGSHHPNINDNGGDDPHPQQ